MRRALVVSLAVMLASCMMWRPAKSVKRGPVSPPTPAQVEAYSKPASPPSE
jgi:hypothetical protein